MQRSWRNWTRIVLTLPIGCDRLPGVIRYDGLYAPQSQDKTPQHHCSHWLRFFPTGDVTTYQIGAIPNTAEKYLRLEKRDVLRGKLQQDGHRIAFELQLREQTISCKGAIDGDALVLTVDYPGYGGFAPRPAGPERWIFFPVKRLAAQ